MVGSTWSLLGEQDHPLLVRIYRAATALGYAWPAVVRLPPRTAARGAVMSDRPELPERFRRVEESALDATLAAIRGGGPAWFWTSEDSALDQQSRCLELERQGLIYRHVETPFGLIAWRARVD